MPNNSAWLTVDGSESDVRISVGGFLDLYNSEELGTALKEASHKAETLQVDFGLAQFIDSAIVQYLAEAGVAMLNRGKRLKVIVTEGSYPKQVIHTVGFDQLMDVVVKQATSMEDR